MGALDGLKVVEAGLLVQGPQAAATLRDWGAEVVKVELPGFGDQARWLMTADSGGHAPYFVGCNRGKRSVTVDLRVRSGREIFLRLAEWADVAITNFKPGTMEAWGLGYEEVAARNSAIIYAAGSTFGPVGPDAAREGADLAAQAAGGLISTTGVDGGEPTPVGASIADHIAAQNLVAGILAALVARGRTGAGQRIDTSLLGGQIWAQAGELTSYLLTGRVPRRANHGNSLVPGVYSIYPTADGWLAIVGVVGPTRKVFFDVLGRPDLSERFPSLMLSEADKDELYAELSPVFEVRTTADWCTVLAEAGVRHAPVRDYSDVAQDRGVRENGYLLSGAEVGSEADVVGTPVRFSATPARAAGTAPELGQHTEEVLLELGYNWEDIGRFRDEAAI
jgi:crotonobetainyl-CoA:carnitine CoA-transferase CaiB-like acyl-CoA transferase